MPLQQNNTILENSLINAFLLVVVGGTTLLFGQAQGLAPTTKQQYSGKQPYQCIFIGQTRRSAPTTS